MDPIACIVDDEGGPLRRRPSQQMVNKGKVGSLGIMGELETGTGQSRCDNLRLHNGVLMASSTC